jgi:hypothetical protein
MAPYVVRRVCRRATAATLTGAAGGRRVPARSRLRVRCRHAQTKRSKTKVVHAKTEAAYADVLICVLAFLRCEMTPTLDISCLPGSSSVIRIKASIACVSAKLPCMRLVPTPDLIDILPTTPAIAPRCRYRILPSHRREAFLSTDATSFPPRPSKRPG